MARPVLPLSRLRCNNAHLVFAAARHRPTPARVITQSIRAQSTTPSSSAGAGRAFNFGEDFSIPLRHVSRLLLRFTRLALLTASTAGLLGFLTYEGMHAYVETACLPADDLPAGEDWGWSAERERWTGRRAAGGGGTDDRLGWAGRHMVRGAWMALHWGVGPDELFTSDEGRQDIDTFGFGVPAREYAFSRAFLARAIARARGRRALGEWPHSDAAQDLISRYAEVLERIGGRRFVLDAREWYAELVEELMREGRADEAARVGGKMGDLGRRLGERESAEEWWVWSVRTAAGERVRMPSGVAAITPVAATAGDELVPPELEVLNTTKPPSRSWFSWRSSSSSTTTTPPPPPSASVPSYLPASLPASPLAQRATAHALVSLSAAYAESGRIAGALVLQRRALELLGPLLASPPSTSSPAPPDPPAKSLHHLTLSHASALLHMHHAESLYSLSPTLNTSPALAHLHSSAQHSESLISALTSTPLTHPDFPASPLPAPPSPGPLAAPFAASPTLRKPAQRLLRDARRAAAHAYALSAIVYERQGEWSRAYDCAERGVGWVGGEDGMGGPVDAEMSAGPGAGAGGGLGVGGAGREWDGLEVERREVWEVWRRVRARVLDEARAAKVVSAPEEEPGK